jgi:hypothetical protein
MFICVFVGYAIYIAYKSFKEASEEEKDIKEVLLETLYDITTYHYILIGIWVAILIVGTFILFITSVMSYIEAN